MNKVSLVFNVNSDSCAFEFKTDITYYFVITQNIQHNTIIKSLTKYVFALFLNVKVIQL